MNLEGFLFKTHKAIIRGYARTLLNFDLLMEEALPPGPKILAANHPTTTDPFLLPLLVDEPIYIFVTGMAFETPLFGKILKRAGHIRVDKSLGNKINTVHQAVKRLAQGGNIGIFPEGSLSPVPGKFCPARTGAARLAVSSGAPVIPVGIHHSPNACFYKKIRTTNYEQTARWVVRGEYYLTVGKAMYFSGDIEDHKEIRCISCQIMDAIIQQSISSQKRMATPQIKWQPLIPHLLRGESLLTSKS